MFLPTAQNRYPSNLNQLDIAAVLSPHSNDEVLSGGKVKRKIVKSSQNAICFLKEIPAVLELGWIYIQLLENLRVPVPFRILVYSPNKQIHVQKKIQNPNILTWLIRKEHTLDRWSFWLFGYMMLSITPFCTFWTDDDIDDDDDQIR